MPTAQSGSNSLHLAGVFVACKVADGGFLVGIIMYDAFFRAVHAADAVTLVMTVGSCMHVLYWRLLTAARRHGSLQNIQ